MTSYEFSFNLKSEIPSSFSGGCGKIKYKIEFVVDIPWKFDKKQTILLNIIQTVNLNYSLGTLQPFENQLTRNIGYIGTGPISLHVYVAKCGYIHGDKIPVQVSSTLTFVSCYIFSFLFYLSTYHDMCHLDLIDCIKFSRAQKMYTNPFQ